MNRILILLLFIGFSLAGKSQLLGFDTPPYSRFLGELAGSSGEISGTILAAGVPADSVWVSVFRESRPNILQFIKATQTNSSDGTYRIEDLDEGTYYLSAEPMTYSLRKRFAPTYFGDSAVWSLSKACFIQGTVSNKNINLTPIVSSKGSEGFSGSIKYSSNVPGYNEGDPVIDAALFIYNVENELIAMTNSDGFGLYSFFDLPNEQIEVIVNSPGKKSSGLIVNPAKLNNDLTFWVSGSRSYGRTDALDVEEDLQTLTSQIFPIPAKNALTINNQNNYQSMHIYDISGSLLLNEGLSNGYNQISISALDNGTYILHLIGEQTIFNQTIIVE